MVKNLKRYRKQVERDQGKHEARKYPELLIIPTVNRLTEVNRQLDRQMDRKMNGLDVDVLKPYSKFLKL